jgi:hypothetical protein
MNCYSYSSVATVTLEILFGMSAPWESFINSMKFCACPDFEAVDAAAICTSDEVDSAADEADSAAMFYFSCYANV